jgi:antitoxin (DNA-binding transcriptional repressor) of toxin-antitoxin stability system
MKTISVVEAQKQLPDLVAALKEGPVLLVRNGQPCAALVGLNERFDREAFSLGRNRRLRRLMDDACRRAETRGIPFSQILREVRHRPAGRTGPRRQPGEPRRARGGPAGREKGPA